MHFNPTKIWCQGNIIMRKYEINENINFTFEDPRELFFLHLDLCQLKGEENTYFNHRSATRKNKKNTVKFT